jgi:outer membrane protein OmpA-like peptidoglycan-associated protein
LSASSARAQDEVDVEGSADPTWLSRMPGYYISGFDPRDFDRHEFELNDNKTIVIEGKKTTWSYLRKEKTKRVSELQVIRNYANALKKIGGQVMYAPETDARLVVKLVRGTSTAWVSVWSEGGAGYYQVIIVEPKTMEQEVTADAAALGEAINTTGKVAVYGIFFDTGKAEVKPESEAALKEIAKLLGNDPKLNLHVVGHTDNQGAFDSNLKLSQQRAEAVVKVLISKHKVAAARLRASGIGPLAPVASNREEAGRALNRRVELVAP